MLSTLGRANDVTQTNKLMSTKLPPTLMQVFSISNNQARCLKCDAVCKPFADQMIFHLTICKGSLVKEKVNSSFSYNCLLCKFKTDKLVEWIKHSFKLDHVTNIVDSSPVVSRSDDCFSCKTHFFGFEDAILRHQCKPKELSSLSTFMAHVYATFKIQENRMLYFCTDCMNYSLDKNNLHGENFCRSVHSSPFVCNFCKVTFYDSTGKYYFKHRVYFEHIMLWCLNGDRTQPKSLVSEFWQLPLFITKHFVMSRLLDQISCVICCEVMPFSYESIYDHSKPCFSSKEISTIDVNTPLKAFNCTACRFKYSDNGKDVYKEWTDHVISLAHLKNTIVKDDKHYLYSYYCYVSETVYFGTSFNIQSFLWATNDEIDRLLFVSEMMADVYRRANVFPVVNTLYCCGLCLYYTENEFCEHKDNDSFLLFYCSVCMVNFNIKSDYTEHLLSSEHIILKYFEASQPADVKVIEYAVENTELCQSVLNKNNENPCTDVSLPAQFELDKETNVLPKNTLIQTSYSPLTVDKDETKVNGDCSVGENGNLLSEPNPRALSYMNSLLGNNYKSEYILNLAEKLDSLPNKSCLIHFLRMKLELLSEMSTTVYATSAFIRSNSYYCHKCDFVFMDELIWTKHDNEFHKNNNNSSMFFCAICQMYYINSSIHISKHIDNVEHTVMMDLQEYLKTCANNPFKESRKEVMKNINGHIIVEVTDINFKLKSDNFYLLRELLEDKLGVFKQLPNNGDSFMMIFNITKQIEDFLKNKDTMAKQYGLKFLIIGENNNKVLSVETVDVLLDWSKLCTVVNNQLKSLNVLTSVSVNKLCNSVYSLYDSGRSIIDLHIFGSQFYGLATKNCNTDLYVNLDDSFHGEIAKNDHLQVELVQMFAKQCLSKPSEFTNVKEIYNVRVPAVQFYHIATKLTCKMTFKSGMDLWNSKLIKSYLSLNNTIKWLVLYIVKIWAPQNGLNNNMFSSYALIWMVLFYLMTEEVIPSVSLLMKFATISDSKVIEGWNCSFGRWTKGVKTLRKYQLLIGFFQYYSTENKLKDNVLCPFTGKLLLKKQFFMKFRVLPEVTRIQRDRLKKAKQDIGSNFEKHNGLAMQDPFELSYNVTENITGQHLVDFCNLCNQSAQLLSNTKKNANEL